MNATLASPPSSVGMSTVPKMARMNGTMFDGRAHLRAPAPHRCTGC